MPKLVLLSEGFTGRTYDLKVDKTTVGRLEDNAFQVADGSVSSHHAEILLRGTDVVISDLDSTNGTFINGDRVSGEVILKPGSILRLGMIEMRLESAEGTPGKPQKQKLDHTIVIPQGVKLNELEGPRSTSLEGKTGFEKKSNTGKAFVWVVGVVMVVLVCLLIWLALRS